MHGQDHIKIRKKILDLSVIKTNKQLIVLRKTKLPLRDSMWIRAGWSAMKNESLTFQLWDRFGTSACPITDANFTCVIRKNRNHLTNRWKILILHEWRTSCDRSGRTTVKYWLFMQLENQSQFASRIDSSLLTRNTTTGGAGGAIS